MKCYYINLDKRKDRDEVFLKQKTPYEWERVSGIDTKPGWIGCRESHLKVLSRVKGVTLIAEDDCLFLRPWSVFDSAVKQLPADWDILYLGATLTRDIERYSKNLYRLRGGYSNTAILHHSDRVAKYVLDRRDDIVRMDMFMVHEVQPRFNCFIIDPMFACQQRGYSDILHKHFDNGLRQRKRFKKYATH